MTEGLLLTLHNGASVKVDSIPLLSIPAFRTAIIESAESGSRIVSLLAAPQSSGSFRLFCILADEEAGQLLASSAEVRDSYPSLAPDCPQAQLFEREIAEKWAIRPIGHPWLKPVRFEDTTRREPSLWKITGDIITLPSVMDFFQVEGEEVHEVAVGPVHAGIIEPGHFRFQCHGETVFHLEISLGYQHRGIENALIAGPDKRTIHYMETAAGDTTIGHTTACCQVLESLSRCQVSFRAHGIRAIALELERMANHAGDLGALAGDVGYLPTASFCGRIRGDYLNMSAMLCGNRFGRGLVRPGGVGYDLTPEITEQLRKRLHTVMKDTAVAVNLLWLSPSVLSRFEETGKISPEVASELGLVGVAARACGIERDCRYNFPAGMYCVNQIPVSTYESGDVFARAYVRWLELQKSAAFIDNQLNLLPPGPIQMELHSLSPGSLAVSLVEGWRGEICHVAITGTDGRFSVYKMVDPSFHNWMGLALALRNQQISDFPLCNKSFNLSYCGHDL